MLSASSRSRLAVAQKHPPGRSLLKQHPGRDSLARKRRSCGWSQDFMLEVPTGATIYYPGTEEAHTNPTGPARGMPQSPRWRVGLVCARMRNFLAGVIVGAGPEPPLSCDLRLNHAQFGCQSQAGATGERGAAVNNPISQRVRTNNHVERTNRMFRFLEKVRYKWRRRKTLVRFVVLTLDDVWSNWKPPSAKETDHTKPAQRGKTQPQPRQTPRRVA